MGFPELDQPLIIMIDIRILDFTEPFNLIDGIRLIITIFFAPFSSQEFLSRLNKRNPLGSKEDYGSQFIHGNPVCIGYFLVPHRDIDQPVPESPVIMAFNIIDSFQRAVGKISNTPQDSPFYCIPIAAIDNIPLIFAKDTPF